VFNDSDSPAPKGDGPDFKRSRRSKAVPVDLMKLDRLPPHSLEAEQGVLGCVLLSPNESMGLCVDKLKGGAETFYDLRHQTLYDLLVGMYDRKEPIDLITVQQKLKDSGTLEGVGGLAYLSNLMDAVPSAANLAYYLDIMREKFVLRRMLRACTQVIGRVHEHEGEVDALIDEVERDILKISEEREEAGIRGMKDLVRGAIDLIQSYHARAGGLTGIGTGLADLDKLTSGLHEGEMIVIAARPSVGKTSLAMNVVEHAIINEGLPVGVFSLEMTSESLVMRMLCSMARVNGRAIRDGFLSEQDMRKLTGAASKMAKAPLYIDDTSGLSILQLRARARRMWQQHGIKLFIIDYMQLLHSSSRKAQDNRQQEVAEISSGVKALAKELKVPVIVLSQLNRDVEKRGKSETPKLSDLRESGSIEQDADVVGLLYRVESEEDENDAAADSIRVNLMIAKQRNGPAGIDVKLIFRKGLTRFESTSPIADEPAQ
jgi:replicative DNA helicase